MGCMMTTGLCQSFNLKLRKMLDRTVEISEGDWSENHPLCWTTMNFYRTFMWIAAVLENSWADEACTEMNAFDKETKGGGIILFYIFLHEYVSYSKEAVISTE